MVRGYERKRADGEDLGIDGFSDLADHDFALEAGSWSGIASSLLFASERLKPVPRLAPSTALPFASQICTQNHC